MFFGRKKQDEQSVRKEVDRMIFTLMKPYEKTENNYTAETFFEQINSLRIIELVVMAEKRFNISFASEQLERLEDKKLDTFVGMVMENLASA